MDSLKIEIHMTRDNLYKNLVKDLHTIIQAKLLSEKNTKDPHIILSQIIHYHSNELLDSFDTTELKFCTIYKEVHALEDIPIHNMTNPNADLNNMTGDNGQDNHTRLIEFCNLSRSCLNTIVSTIIQPHQMYYERLEDIEIDISLNELHHSTSNEDTPASDKKVRLDPEATTPPDLVKDLLSYVN